MNQIYLVQSWLISWLKKKKFLFHLAVQLSKFEKDV